MTNQNLVCIQYSAQQLLAFQHSRLVDTENIACQDYLAC